MYLNKGTLPTATSKNGHIVYLNSYTVSEIYDTLECYTWTYSVFKCFHSTYFFINFLVILEHIMYLVF